jgi:hypothetical protein
MVGVGSEGPVSDGAEIGEGVSVRAGDVGETGTGVGFAMRRCSVAAGRSDGVTKACVGTSVVNPMGCDSDLLQSSKKRISKRMATINLKRSYPGERVEASMKSL